MLHTLEMVLKFIWDGFTVVPEGVSLGIWEAAIPAVGSLVSGLLSQAAQKAEANKRRKFEMQQASEETQGKAAQLMGQNQISAFQQLMAGYRDALL